MLHSGSRDVGNLTAVHHDKVAAKKGFPDPQGLNYMRIDSQEGQVGADSSLTQPPWHVGLA